MSPDVNPTPSDIMTTTSTWAAPEDESDDLQFKLQELYTKTVDPYAGSTLTMGKSRVWRTLENGWAAATTMSCPVHFYCPLQKNSDWDSVYA